MFIPEDIFGGGQGSQAQGTPTAAGGASQGGTGQVIRNWLSSITGAYSSITGAGRNSGPAPAPAPAPRDVKGTWLAIGGVLALLVALVFLLRK